MPDPQPVCATYSLLGNRVQMTLAFALVALGIASEADTSSGPEPFGLALAAILLVCAVRAARAGIQMDKDGCIVVRNIIRTHRVPRASVTSVELAGRWYLFGILALTLTTKSGKRITSINMSPGYRSEAREAVGRCMSDLREAIA